jgi:type I restriction enzyme S subunit
MAGDDRATTTIEELIASGAIVAHKDGNYGSSYPRAEEFGTEGVPFLTAKSLREGYVDIAGAPRLGDARADELRFGFVQTDDVLLSHNATIGRVAVVPQHKGRLLVGTSLTYFRLNPQKLLPRYLAVYFAGADFQNQLVAVMSHSTRNQVPVTAQRKLNVVVPPLAKQKAIAAVLGALEDKIELNRRMNATLEAMARALFQSWFVDFDPVRAKLDGRPPAALDPATAALFPEHLEDSTIGKKPIGWEVTALDNVLAVLETGGRPKGGVSRITSGVPSIGAESIVSVGVFDFAKTKYVPIEFHEGMRKGHIQSHDVLLYKDGGRPGEYEPHVSMFGDGFPFEKCSINEHVYRLRTNERLSQEFLYFWMTSEFALSEMRIKGTGVAIPGLNSTAVRSLGVLVPPRPIVDAFTRQAAPLITRLLANAKQSRTLATLRDTLLPKLLSGEMNVQESTN